MKKTICRRLLLLCFMILFAGKAFSSEAILPVYLSDGAIAHACGGINNHNYTNSQEALEQALRRGVKVVEIDFLFTKDKKLVCSHDWSRFNGKKPTLKKFLKKKTKGGYTSMKAETALGLLARSRGTYLVVDTKESNIKKVYKRLAYLCRRNGYTDLMNRIVPQIYKKADFQKIKSVYPFRNWIFSLYKMKITSEKQYTKLAKFCRKNGIGVITMPKKSVTASIVTRIHKRGINVAAHTVNKLWLLRKLRQRGVDAIYTDYLY